MSKVVKKEQIEYPFLTQPITLCQFDNGHKVILAKKDSPMLNISSWVKTGSINENNENNGVSHFVEHLLFKGTNKYKAGVFDRKMEEKGGIINAATWKDYTFYYINIPQEHYKLALEMHADMMVDAVFPVEEIGETFNPDGVAPKNKRERYVVIEEIRMCEDNNWRKVYKNLNNAMYQNHPYKREVIGTKQIIANIPQEEIVRYYQTFYTPQNITTIVVGNFDEEEMIKLINKNFKFKDNSKIKKCKTDKRKKEIKIAKPSIITDCSEVNTAYIMFGWLCDSAKKLKETIALDLISTILGDGKSSRLHSEFIEKPKQPHYYQIESCHYQFKDGDNFFVEANFDSSKKDIVIKEIKNELAKLENIEEEELKKAKKRALVNFAQDSEMVSDIADTIGYYTTVVEDITQASNYIKTLEEIDCKYLQKIAKKYLNSKNAMISLLLPKEGE